MKFLLLGLFLITGQAIAQSCDYSITMGSFTGNVNDTEQTVSHTAVLTRPTNSSSSNCNEYRVYFGKGNANSYQRKAYNGQYSLNYNLYRTVNRGNILKEYSDASNGEFIANTANNPNTASTSTFFVGFPDLETIFSQSPAGVYTDVVPVMFYRVRQNGNIEYETTRNLTISFNLPRYAELSIFPVNAPDDVNSITYFMDFGTMAQNQELRADLRVKGNVGYGVMLSSMNGGKLMPTAGGNSIVPYQIKVGNGNYFTPSPAGSQFTVAQNNFGTASSGERYNLRVKLGTFGQLEDGDYQEVITITVQAW